MTQVARREALAAGAMAAVSAIAPRLAVGQPAAKAVRKGRLKQSVSRWCYKTIPDREFYKAVALREAVVLCDV
jgi:hypothetical protein